MIAVKRPSLVDCVELVPWWLSTLLVNRVKLNQGTSQAHVLLSGLQTRGARKPPSSTHLQGLTHEGGGTGVLQHRAPQDLRAVRHARSGAVAATAGGMKSGKNRVYAQ